MTDIAFAPTPAPAAPPAAGPPPLPMAEVIRSLGKFEGRAVFMYLDTRGLVTVGVGKMLPDAHAAEALPFVHRVGGGPAGAADIAAEFARVTKLRPARPLGAYAPGVLILAEAEIDILLTATVNGFLVHLRQVFADFDAFPVPAREALVDMTYNLGIGVPGGVHGLYGYHHLLVSVRAGDWTAAAHQCVRNGIGTSRNNWTHDKFLEAGGAG